MTGLMNMQYAIADGQVYVLEANPRASRTVPLVSKVCNVSMARQATELIIRAEQGLEQLPLRQAGRIPHFGVKEAVFPFSSFPEVDPVLGPEMRSTGEVLGLADSFELAFFKAQEAVLAPLPTSGTVLISVNAPDKQDALAVARIFHKLGFAIMATQGTCRLLQDNALPALAVKKLYEGRPNILDHITNKEVQLVINTAAGKRSQHDDSYIRKAAIRYNIPYITTMTAALASVRGIAAYMARDSKQPPQPKSLQEYHAGIH